MWRIILGGRAKSGFKVEEACPHVGEEPSTSEQKQWDGGGEGVEWSLGGRNCQDLVECLIYAIRAKGGWREKERARGGKEVS